MKRSDRTSMGGAKSRFESTEWSKIRRAQTRDEILRRMITESIMKRYWKPVYCYLRRKGHDNESAKDLTQGFFDEIVLGRDLIQQADQSKGRFRTFLLTALDRYVIDVHDKQAARMRMPQEGLVSLEGTDLPDLPAPQSEAGAEEAFHYAWATSLLDEVLRKVREQYYKEGKAAHWEVFNARVVAPIFGNTKAPSLAEVCSKYRIDTEIKASNMAITVKRRFRTVLMRCLQKSVDSDSEVEEEFSELIRILSKGGA